MNKRLIMQMYVESATSLFEEHGYDSVTVDDIAAGCKKTRTCFYHYFKSKDDLMLYLSKMEEESYKKILKEVDLTFVGQPDKRLMKLLVDRMMLLYNSSFFKIAIKNDLFERLEGMQEIRDDFDKALLEQYLKIVRDGIQLGVFVSLDKVATFFQFYQKMQKGIEATLFEQEHHDQFVEKFSVAVELAVKAISLNTNVMVSDILE
jgi:AcrR family transcriptional regulator